MLKRIMICCLFASMNLSAGNATSFYKIYNDFAQVVTTILSGKPKSEHPLLSPVGKDLRNVLDAISYLQNVKKINSRLLYEEGIVRKLRQSDISDEPISRYTCNHESRFDKPLHQKLYKKQVVNIPS